MIYQRHYNRLCRYIVHLRRRLARSEREWRDVKDFGRVDPDRPGGPRGDPARAD
ncbi:hypothetical protein J1TS5_03850 [Paenibacillus macerans]|nr:hypothetical protein J1TS5_03850 [Paenibacillus macerans]